MGKTSFLKEAEERLEIRIARDFGAARLRPLVVDAATEDLETMERLTSLESRPFIVLLVDEVQTSTRRNKEIYKRLHTGKTNPPIMPLFAGLSDSRTVLEDPERTGLTRIPPGTSSPCPY